MRPWRSQPDPMIVKQSMLEQDSGLARCPRRALAGAASGFKANLHSSHSSSGPQVGLPPKCACPAQVLEAVEISSHSQCRIPHLHRYTPAGQIRERPHLPHGIGSLQLALTHALSLSRFQLHSSAPALHAQVAYPLDRLYSGLGRTWQIRDIRPAIGWDMLPRLERLA